jgi:hypothetical protein
MLVINPRSQQPHLKDLLLDFSDRFKGKNVADFLSRLKDRFEAMNVTQSEQNCQALIAITTTDIIPEIKMLDGYAGRDWKELKAAIREEYEAGDERQLKETIEYLQGITKQSEQGKLKTRGFIKEFKAR